MGFDVKLCFVLIQIEEYYSIILLVIIFFLIKQIPHNFILDFCIPRDNLIKVLCIQGKYVHFGVHGKAQPHRCATARQLNETLRRPPYSIIKFNYSVIGKKVKTINYVLSSLKVYYLKSDKYPVRAKKHNFTSTTTKKKFKRHFVHKCNGAYKFLQLLSLRTCSICGKNN